MKTVPALGLALALAIGCGGGGGGGGGDGSAGGGGVGGENGGDSSLKAWGIPGLIESNDIGGASQPQVAVDSNGNAIAVWIQYDGTRYNAWSNVYE